ncbi:MAG: cytochrome [Microbacterium sp. 67-17]|uniref:cytochrome P450 n=1 Tax=Microbacterium sp. 67-17 TaxID=1895782 RepID=UPI00096635EC|nr:cytochrome P450 [Microbacterium sp. 67-17]OJW02518.1 MAG: cytochrome [Microbacterium sp. 67-17]
MTTIAIQDKLPIAPEFDAMSDDYFADPAGYFARFRDDTPVFFYPHLGAWIVTRREDILTVLGDWTEFSSAANAADIEVPEKWHHILPPGLMAQLVTGMDPEGHTRHRAVLQRGFTKARMEAIQPEIEARAHRIIDKIEHAGGGNIMEMYCLELTTQTLLAHLGLGWEHDAMMRQLRSDMARVLGSSREPIPTDLYDGVWERYVLANQKLQDIVKERRENPGDDFISEMATQKDPRTGDYVLSPAQIALHICEFAMAGTDSTSQAMTAAIVYLHKNPQALADAQADPALWTNVFEETIRLRPSAPFASRQAMRDMELSGVKIAKGDMLWVALPSANTEPGFIERPFEFDIHRENIGDHLAFTRGRHTCIGQALARVQGPTGLKVLFERLPSLRPAGEIPMDFLKMVLLPVRLSLPVTWDLGDIENHATRVLREMDLTVLDVTSAADGVVAVTLGHPDGDALPQWTAGAHVDVQLVSATGEKLTRQYSLSGDPAGPETWRLGVLREPASRGGSLAVHRLAVGDTVRVGWPRNNFALEPAPKYVFVAGGVGLTPILPMIRQAEAQGAEWELHFGGRTRASMAFLDELAAHGDRVRLYPQDEVGHPPLAEIFAEVREGALVYACGPEPLLAALETTLAHWPEGSLRTERFAPKPIDADAPQESFEVEFALSGVTLRIPADKTILEVAEEAGLAAISSCREGTCGTCETPILSGEADHRDSILSTSEQKANRTMMICVSRAAGNCPRLVLDA